ncbi:ankyrin repeat-containing domain protein [Pseudoneurospora amorphoporcata]|uniref:Ankyrin repeat-containing domain protein n=1 Tax=Pseudoneurospora amorphoporcata TaxID=241081 RepID=A0AAN6SBN5_9PEZI|nr:ankyrin repeat-containing domain protein [Pseudoneurospora amorphoporcata]
MRRRLRSSSFQSYFKRDGNAEDREGSMDQEQSRPAPLLELPTSIQHISATTSTSSFSLPASLPLPAAPATGFTDVETSALQLPLAPATGFTNVETSTPRPPATPATGSADTETSAGVDNTKQVEKPYHNLPLSPNDIRLLRLSPSENEDAAIHCELFCTALDSKGTRPYEALSYVWGSEAKPCSISINGCDLPVGENLHAALLHLRDQSIERTIWIDAICINQDDEEEKGHQVQSMAKIYAKASRVIVWLGKEVAGSDQALEEIRIAAELSTLKEIRITAELFARRLDNKAGILTLLQRPWFQRIWVLQEVAAARHTLIKCGSAEIDGFVFCSGLNALNLSSELPADLRARILSVTYLIRGAIFQPKYATSQSDNFSLDIRPLGELIEMYHTREATDRRDKVYALLGMSSDNPTAEGLFADYKISWKQLFNKLIHFFLSELVSVVGLSDDKENAVIESKGCILGEVSSVKRNATWEDKQDVAITWRNAPSYICVKEAWVSCWTLPTTVKSVQKGDVVCLLQGATRPTILRPYNDHWAVIMIAVSPAGDSQATTRDIKWSELLQSITVFPHNFLLIWDWNINPDRQQDKNNHNYFASIPEHSKTGLEGCLDAATRIRNVRLVLQEVKQYGVAVKNLREETAVLERALRSMSTLKKTCLSPEDSEKKDAKEIMVNQLIKDKGQWTLLCLAAENGHETVVKLLLDTSKVNLHREELRTALWFAEQKDHKAIVKMLLDTGKVDAGTKNENGQTALYRAAITGHEVVIQLLFDTVEVDLHSKELQKVLHMAAKNGHEAAVKLLLDSGTVDAGALDKDGRIALHSAAAYGREAVVKLLLTGKVNADAKDRDGRTALHSAAENGHEAVIKLLLDTGKVDADAKDKDGRTALHIAAMYRHEAVVKLLLDTGKVDADAKDKDGRTALHWAVENGHKAVVKLLLDTGKVDADAKDKDGRTALYTAVENGHKAVVKLLLDTGKVNADPKDRAGRTALYWAAKNGHEAVVKLLLDTGKDGRTALYTAAENGHEAVVKLLLDTGKVDADPKDKDGRTALYTAAENGHEAVVKLLLDTGKVDADAKDKYGRTALYMAAKNGHEAVVKLLLDTGKVDADPQDWAGRTALYSAAENGHEAVIKLLLDTGKVDADPQDKGGWTALHIAARNGHEAVVKLLSPAS